MAHLTADSRDATRSSTSVQISNPCRPIGRPIGGHDLDRGCNSTSIQRVVRTPSTRHPGRPAGGPVIVMIADGWPRSVFNRLLSNGDLPEMSDWLTEGAAHLTDVVSVVPSVSITSHATLLTATQPRAHGIPGHRWMSTEDRELRNYLRRGAHRINSDLLPHVGTVFECSHSSSAVQSVVSRGADTVLRRPTQDSTYLLRKSLEQVLRDPAGTHVLWLPYGDAAAHRYGPNSDEVEGEMRKVSRGVGSYLEEIQAAGFFDEATIVIVPDHGHRVVERTTSLRGIARWVGRTTGSTSVLVNPTFRTIAGAEESVILSSGDSAVYIYLAGAPGDSQLEDVVQRLAVEQDFELVVAKLSGCRHLVVSDRGSSMITERVPGRVADYKVLAGADPLGLEETTTIDLTSPRPQDRYPDFVNQYLGSHVVGRSAPILGFAKRGNHFGWGPRIGWRLGNHRGSHGGPLPEEVIVSALAMLPHRPQLDSVVRSGDLLRECGILPEVGISSDRHEYLGI